MQHHLPREGRPGGQRGAACLGSKIAEIGRAACWERGSMLGGAVRWHEQRTPGFDRLPCLAFLPASPALRISPTPLCLDRSKPPLSLLDRSDRSERRRDTRCSTIFRAKAGPEGSEGRRASARRSPRWAVVVVSCADAAGRLRTRDGWAGGRLRPTALPRVPAWVACAPNVTNTAVPRPIKTSVIAA